MQKIKVFVLVIIGFFGCRSRDNSNLKDAILYIPKTGIIDLYIEGDEVIIRPCANSSLILTRKDCKLPKGMTEGDVVRRDVSELKTHLSLALSMPEVFALTSEYKDYNDKLSTLYKNANQKLNQEKSNLLKQLQKIKNFNDDVKPNATQKLNKEIIALDFEINNLTQKLKEGIELKKLKSNLINSLVNKIIDEIIKSSNLFHFQPINNGKPSLIYGILASYIENLPQKIDVSSIFKAPSKFTVIRHGSFLMGSPASELERRGEYESQHKVTISNDFEMLTTEVSQKQYYDIMGYNPSNIFNSLNDPVEYLSWFEAILFCNKLSEKFNLKPYYKIIPPKSIIVNSNGETSTYKYIPPKVIILGGTGYRLPTEAEWEYAARAGTTTPFYLGTNITSDKINYLSTRPYNNGKVEIARNTTVAVGSLPNENNFHLYDMLGNVNEWVYDRFSASYQNLPPKDPTGPEDPSFIYRTIRGGSYISTGAECRSASRELKLPYHKSAFIGFRVVRTFK